MAKKTAFTETKYDVLIGLLIDLLIKIGYTPIPKRQKSKDVIRLGLESSRPIEASELGFHYSNNGHRAVVWTSWIPELEKFREVGTDTFWSIVTNNDELVYCAKPIARIDEDSIIDLAKQAWINKWKIDNLPLCPCCGARMEIFRKPKTRQYMFACKRNENHKTEEYPNGKWHFMNWDYGLGPKAKEFLDIRREATAQYKERMEKIGKSPIPRALIRKSWMVTKPQNLIQKST